MRDWINLIESFGRVIDWNPRAQSPNLQLFDLDVAAHKGTIEKKDIAEFASFLRSHKMDFVRLYHATSLDHPIPDKGLLPTSATRAKSLQSGHGYVYLSYDPESALSFARMAYAGQYRPLVIYAVEVTIGRLSADTDQLRNKRFFSGIEVGNSLAESLIYGRGARVKGKIDPMQLTVFGHYDHHGNPIDDPSN